MIQLDISRDITDLTSVHTTEYITNVKSKSESLGHNENFIDSTNDVYFDKDTFVTAKLSADACISAVEQVINDESPL